MQLAEEGVPVPGDPLSMPCHLLGSLTMDVPEELQEGITWSRRERLSLALLKLKDTAALYKAAKNLCYNT